MIVISGATGQLGSQIVQQLLLRVPSDRIALSVRDTTKAPAGLRARHGDFNDPSSLASSFADATQVLIISANDTGDAAVAAHTAAVDAARGAERILYTSHQAAAPDSLFPPMRDHAGTEQHLASTAVPYTSLRNGFYASTVPLLLGRALETGELVAPADGPVSWTAHADLAEAAAIILAGEAVCGVPTPPLTGAEALDLADVAAILTELTGRPIRRVIADDQEWLSSLTGHGVPVDRATMLLGMFHASRRGEFTTVDPTLEKLLGRPPITLRTVLESVSGPTPAGHR